MSGRPSRFADPAAGTRSACSRRHASSDFGSRLPDPGRRVRIGLFAGWAALCALSARWAG
ncbi:MAG TPA: hypothetical protein VHS32_15410 [Streptosporangiaceae bacterium]|nr:hypothetical protein [Streptosporangiaceae bacterium]